jgi:FlaA1/EpsC-like NDP-sugar epimerase
MLDILKRGLAHMPRTGKRAVLLSLDAAFLMLSVWGSYCLRYGVIYAPTPRQWLLIMLAPVVAIPVFVRMGLYRAVIRYLPERAIWTMLQAVTLAAMAWIGLVFILEMAGNGTVPRTVPLLFWFLASFFIIGSRFTAQKLLWIDTQKQKLERGQLLIYGAGETGSNLAGALRTQGRRLIAGFIDDNPALQGRDIAGIRVHPFDRLPSLIANMGVREIVLSMPSLDSAGRQRIVERLAPYPLKIRTLPPLVDVLSGKYQISALREFDIDDLLGRSTVPPEDALLETMIAGRAILVTGAGGSIGSELCRQVMLWRPKVLVLYEQNEFALYNIHRELAAVGAKIVPVLASVTNEAALSEAVRTHAIEVLFHAAAHKHVPLVEANIIEGVCNNVFGSLTATRVAFENNVRNFVLISSDKAVRPTNVMGATKRWSELIMNAFAERAKAEGRNQKFCAVRFGNVLGSNGSVVPLFKEQIAKGGPVTLTHPDMERYFMSIHEAAELIVQAGALSHGGDIFLLEMGMPIKISDLAQNMIRLAGESVRDERNPGGGIEIVALGPRPGEKMFEELFYDPTLAQATQHPKILRSLSENTEEVMPALAGLEEAVLLRNELQAKERLFELIGQRRGAS